MRNLPSRVGSASSFKVFTERYYFTMVSDKSSNPGSAAGLEPMRNPAKNGPILFERNGFRIRTSPAKMPSSLYPYEAITHVYVADRMFLIGLTSGLLTLRSQLFDHPETGPAEARTKLLERVAKHPGGEAQLAQMELVDRLAERNPSSWITWITIALCVLGTFFQLQDPVVEQVGAYVPDLFVRGEYWRAITAHFLHGIPRLPVHLAFNVGGLVVLGHLVERPLGAWRTAMVLGCGALGTILGIHFGDHATVMGASGLVAALAGAIVALEFNYPETLPAYWRLPRRIFVGALILQFIVIDRMLSDVVAGGAHLGGFLAGFIAIWLLGRPMLEDPSPSMGLRVVVGTTLLALILGLLGALPLVRHDMEALERHAIRLLNAPIAANLAPLENAAAWFIVTEKGASDAGLESAVALADRAVVSTRRLHPGILDTLAEALFQRGDRIGAILIIDEAISLVPQEPYFLEQRRRFAGDRERDDRPPPPGSSPRRPLPFEDDLESRSIDSYPLQLTI